MFCVAQYLTQDPPVCKVSALIILHFKLNTTSSVVFGVQKALFPSLLLFAAFPPYEFRK